MRHKTTGRFALALTGLLALAAVARAEEKFDEVELLVSLGQKEWSDRLRLAPDGAVVLERSRSLPAPEHVTLRGKATKDELARLLGALASAAFAKLPRNLVPDEPGLPAPGGIVQVRVTKGQRSHATIARLAEYGAHGARLAPLVESLRAIAARVGDEGLTKERHVVGKVVVRGDDVLVEEGARRLLVTNEPFRSLIRKRDLPGAQAFVTLRARVLERGEDAGTAEVLALGVTGGADGAIVRAEPKKAAAEVARLARGANASVVAREGDWLAVNVGDRIGWVRATELEVGVRTVDVPLAGARTQGLNGALPR